uniref:SAC domain-containing protein n=1 Tax=Caenorhabditis japonica TaxID=281687 RepID=A0A8R1EAW6_CAEJA
MLQHGICRTNCVDCLDRTNVAQFVIAKVALGCQLCAMGILDEPNLTLQSEVCRLLEDMFDEHGDTMALQYAGSQLVHSIKTYKKTAAFQERRRDVFQTLSRYYSNTFNDWDKQMAINLFLGVFRPKITSIKNLWDLTSDYNLHFPYPLKVRTDYCAWMLTEKELDELVFLDYDEDKSDPESFVEIRSVAEEVERRGSDGSDYRTLQFSSHEDFRDYHKTYEFTPLDDRIGRLFSIENRAIQVDGINEEPTSHAQFLKLWKTTETKEKEPKKPSKKEKEEKESDDEDDDEENSTQWSDVVEAQKEWYDLVSQPGNVSTAVPTQKREPPAAPSRSARQSILRTGLLFAKDIYHLDHLKTQPEERKYYEKYARSAFKCNVRDWEKVKPTLLSEFKINPDVEPRKPTFFTADDCYRTEPPEVSGNSERFYAKSARPLTTKCSNRDFEFFSNYLTAS